MKLRIRGNSLRLRLTHPGVMALLTNGFVENEVQLGVKAECALVYRLELSVAVTKPTAVFRNARLCVHLPVVGGMPWARGEDIGIYAEEAWGLKLAMEKDFKCLDLRSREEESDASENPNGSGHAVCSVTSD